MKRNLNPLFIFYRLLPYLSILSTLPGFESNYCLISVGYHDFDATDKDVVVRFPVHTLGDTIAWFSYVERFQQKLNCKLTCVVSA